MTSNLFQILLFYFSYFSYFSFLVNTFNVVGWYDGDYNGTINIPPFVIQKYTHIVTGFPTQFTNGTVKCNLDDKITQNMVKIARKYNKKIQWRGGLNLSLILFNDTTDINTTQIKINYFNSINKALYECDIDGIEYDFEWENTKWSKFDIIPSEASTTYTHFLLDLKQIVGNTKIISADVSSWGLFPGAYPFGFKPWINVTLFNKGRNNIKIDFLNVMSYHWDINGSIMPWIKDVIVYKYIWKFDQSRINLAIPYFSMNYTLFPKSRIYNEPLWGGLSSKCPNIDENVNICDNILFVGKNMNKKISQLVKKEQFGGLFPWAMNYDSFEHNNTLINYVDMDVSVGVDVEDVDVSFIRS